MNGEYKKLRDFDTALHALRRQYPDYPSTFGRCSTEGCNNGGRGSGKCSDCIEIKLSHLVGLEKAKQLHDAIRLQAAINNEIREMLYDKE